MTITGQFRYNISNQDASTEEPTIGLLTSYFQIQDLRAASLENPRFSLNDPAAWDALGAEPSSSGIRINSEKALTYSPWWRGINLVAGSVAKLPCNTYRRVGDKAGAGKELDLEHPSYFLLRRKANDYQTSFQLKQQLTGHALSEGNGYAFIDRDGAGRPVALLPMDPHTVAPVRENGTLLYVVEAGTEKRKLSRDSVLHVKGFGYDGICGFSVVVKARDDLGLGVGARTYESTYLKNNARPSVVLEHPGRMDPKQVGELRDSWNSMHQGLENAHKTAILQNGLKANVISFSAKDSQLLETRQFTIRDIANWIGVPPHKIGDTTRGGYNSLESENQAWLDDSLDYWLCGWEEECWDKLLTEEEKRSESHVIEFYRKALLRGDMTARSNYNRTALAGAPWQTVNEVREEEGRNPIEGGDEIVNPLNMAKDRPPDEPPAAPGRKSTAPPDDGDEDADARFASAHKRIVADAVRRMTFRVVASAQRAAKDAKAFMAWLDAIADEHGPAFGDALGPASEIVGVDLAAWLMGTIRKRLDVIADQSTPKSLAGDVATLFEQLPTALGERAATEFVAGDYGPRVADRPPIAYAAPAKPKLITVTKTLERNASGLPIRVIEVHQEGEA